MSTIANRVAGFGTTIFTEINMLAQQHQAINLGQGQPDFDGPNEAVQAFVDALQSGDHNQYAPGPGTSDLKQGIANHVARSYGLDIDPIKGTVVTAGGTEAIFSTVLGLIDPGDEVIIVEPFFDSYVPNVIMANGKPIFVPLHAPDWTFDPDELRAAFNPNTRAIMINTPHNPTGRVLTLDELTTIAGLCKEFDVVVISDEVYEHLIFDDSRHIPMATLPGMLERTVTIGSAGKTFGMTGWKIGWAYGHPDLIKGVAQAHQYVTFAVNHPAQQAVAHALTLPSSYYEDYREMYTTKRDLMMTGIAGAGLKATMPKGTYFVVADFTDVFDGTDVEFARYMATEIGVGVIPPTAFYSEKHKHMGQNHVRFSFPKQNATLQTAAERMKKLKA